ncbi:MULTISPECIES: hypothetical protein [Streptomyces]|uniref:Uncharacterized protein n=1 Tax=Streptomyces spinosisporus TaxID=2927582 RepID=A0ABS9XJ28_9ACTN|nr:MULTISPECIES: hypothetical protein [Streptomyces]MCI3242083.1 hypothetical protein [Streptomyces spinosisporus]WUB34157.1 hypothetical protein OHN38_04280 [Streptomyces sp. NBC_00588]
MRLVTGQDPVFSAALAAELLTSSAEQFVPASAPGRGEGMGGLAHVTAGPGAVHGLPLSAYAEDLPNIRDRWRQP